MKNIVAFKDWFPLGLATVVFIIDQITKYFIVNYLQFYGVVSIFGDWFKLRFIENSGMAFGIASDVPKTLEKDISLALLTLSAIGLMFYFYRKLDKNILIERSAFMLILGGAFGNLSDKLFGYIIFHHELKLLYGRVVDFLDLGYGGYRWPTFNVADISISVGVIIIFIWTFFFDKKPTAFSDCEK